MDQKEFQLFVKHGPEPGKVYPLESVRISIGRDPLSDITINDPEVSRRHAQLVSSPTGYTIQDLGSTNGTLIDGTRLAGEPVELYPGQIISFGTGVALVFEVISTAEGESDAAVETVILDGETAEPEATPEPAAEVEESPPGEEELATIIDHAAYAAVTGDESGDVASEFVEEIPPEAPPAALPPTEALIPETPPVEPESFIEEPPAKEPVVVPQEGAAMGAEAGEKSGRRTTSIVIATILILCCCCSALAIFMYYYGGDFLLRQAGIVP